MKVFLSGASAELDRCANAMDDLRLAGHVITFDWVAHIRDVSKGDPGAGPTVDHDHGIDTLRTAAEADLQGVRDADIFIVLAPGAGNSSTGCWVELGYAVKLKESLGRDNLPLWPLMDIIWVGPRRGPFWTMATRVFEDWTSAKKWIGAA